MIINTLTVSAILNRTRTTGNRRLEMRRELERTLFQLVLIISYLQKAATVTLSHWDRVFFAEIMPIEYNFDNRASAILSLNSSRGSSSDSLLAIFLICPAILLYLKWKNVINGVEVTGMV